MSAQWGAVARAVITIMEGEKAEAVVREQAYGASQLIKPVNVDQHMQHAITQGVDARAQAPVEHMAPIERARPVHAISRARA